MPDKSDRELCQTSQTESCARQVRQKSDRDRGCVRKVTQRVVSDKCVRQVTQRVVSDKSDTESCARQVTQRVVSDKSHRELCQTSHTESCVR